jgi:hypothetical protein
VAVAAVVVVVATAARLLLLLLLLALLLCARKAARRERSSASEAGDDGGAIGCVEADTQEEEGERRARVPFLGAVGGGEENENQKRWIDTRPRGEEEDENE